MAQIIRSAKSGSSWTENELRAYNITIQSQDADADNFFGGHHVLSIDGLDPHLFTPHPFAIVNGASPLTRRLLNSLTLASTENEESSIDTFVQCVMEIAGFGEWDLDLSVCVRRRVPLMICGNKSAAAVDVCILQRSTKMLLLIQEDKTVEKLWKKMIGCKTKTMEPQ